LILLVAIGTADLGVGTELWPRVLRWAVLTTLIWAVLGSVLLNEPAAWHDASELPDFWNRTPNGYFMEHRRPGWKRGSQKKLCFVATDKALLADVLQGLASRPDCLYVKYSLYQKDGMYLGRCFLVGDHQVGLLWAKFKEHPRLFCSVQDDDFTSPFRPS
jgi:hypothetical protein